MSGITVPLVFPCPGNYCSKNKFIHWNHAKCGTTAYIDQDGQISCQSCYGSFSIINAGFKCAESTHGASYDKWTKSAFYAVLAEFTASLQAQTKDQKKRQYWVAVFIERVKPKC